MTSLELFRCEPYACRLTRAACAQRHQSAQHAGRPSPVAVPPSLRWSLCRTCEVGAVLDRAGVPTDASERHLIAQCDHATLAAAMREAGLVADALIVDAPYSERTHAGHDAISVKAVELGRRPIDYAPWGRDDVSAFVAAWAPVVRGWMCSVTDDVLSGPWRAEMERSGRCGFAPLPLVQFGSRVRISGDGPSSITTWVCVSRPRSVEFARWGTLPGAYVQPQGAREVPDVVGGKTRWSMRAIVGDYSRPGDLVADPCMGAGTTLVAAVELGRRAIGCEPDAGRYAIAAKRLAKTRPQLRMRLDCEETRGEQGALFGGE